MRFANSVVTAVLVCVLAVPVAFAADSGDSLPLDAVRSQQAEIQAGVQAGSGFYGLLSARDRDELLSRQARMLAMIEGKQTSGELSEADKIELFNTLEWIEATVNRTKDDRMVCEHRKVLGSNHKQKVCRTARQIRQEHETARDQISQRGVGGALGGN